MRTLLQTHSFDLQLLIVFYQCGVYQYAIYKKNQCKISAFRQKYTVSLSLTLYAQPLTDQFKSTLDKKLHDLTWWWQRWWGLNDEQTARRRRRRSRNSSTTTMEMTTMNLFTCYSFFNTSNCMYVIRIISYHLY